MQTLEQLRAGALQGATRLQLRGGLTDFPREIFDLADTLEILDLTGNALCALPDDLPRLHKLRILFCSNNRFTELPAMLGRMPALTMVGFRANRITSVPATALPPALRWLVLTDNQIAHLPDALGRRPALQKLMLAGNRLRALPDTMAELHQLELLRLSANAFEALPDWLPTLPRLAWLACAGNPWGAGRAQAMRAAPAAAIGWQQLTLHEQLGEGASGMIFRADWRHSAGQDKGSTPVAVKLYKSDMTSDGSPLNEMAACVAAGRHPNLIPVLGRVTGHPEQAHGLVMALLDPGFVNLAGPPSFASCTRDVYDDGKRLDWPAMLAIAHGVAAAAAQLHQRGIVHGDLYAHNILHDAAGRCVLSDFGAAAFYDPAAPLSAPLQRLEVRAFGLLLEELLALSAPPAALRAGLAALQAACVAPDVTARPLFGTVVTRLHALRQDAIDRPR
ncbi:protein kinase [Duganella sp. Leaf126]|uniref:leucine-rich repeat-containing protein kinase family protein n=1 Tax=Duganella sp. Leaf126 TaxID=1736266 RepID=UPI0006F556E1|nr:leucine-rich repeat-containing protein kinase family protein [Duganella sp. Leaf126]KQQ31951.1 protein kinase [Duganella sp. Leaf126]